MAAYIYGVAEHDVVFYTYHKNAISTDYWQKMH